MRKPDALELGWAAFALLNVAAMVLFPGAAVVPFHLIWVSLTLLYGVRVWRWGATVLVPAAVAVVTAAVIAQHALAGHEGWLELAEVPLMTAMFLAMVWHARRRQDALSETERVSEQRAALLAQQQRFFEDASHELRTPVTIARGHLETLQRSAGRSPEAEVALDELARIGRIVDRLLLLARPTRDEVAAEPIDLEPFLEDVYLRWAEILKGRLRLGARPTGIFRGDGDSLRAALDALIENAAQYTRGTIEIAGHVDHEALVLEVIDKGPGIPEDVLPRIFDRFSRADAARSRREGGTGLGLAVVAAVAKAHGGECGVRSTATGSTFRLRLPFRAQGRPSDSVVDATRPVARASAPDD